MAQQPQVESEQKDRPAPEATRGDRRSFLTSTSTVLMASGLAAGYGTFFAMAGRFLFPSGKDKMWLFVAKAASIPPARRFPLSHLLVCRFRSRGKTEAMSAAAAGKVRRRRRTSSPPCRESVRTWDAACDGKRTTTAFFAPATTECLIHPGRPSAARRPTKDNSWRPIRSTWSTVACTSRCRFNRCENWKAKSR